MNSNEQEDKCWNAGTKCYLKGTKKNILMCNKHYKTQDPKPKIKDEEI